MKTTIRNLALALACSGALASAQAGVLTFQDVVFTTSWSNNVLTLEIDAAERSGDWSRATMLGALSLKEIGSFKSVTLTAAPKGVDAWQLSARELNAKGCAGGGGGRSSTNLCIAGAPIALTDNMVFTFAFTGAPMLDAPHLKVSFLDSANGKAGSLLSQTIPLARATAPLPAPTPSSPTPAPAASPPPVATPPVVTSPVIENVPAPVTVATQPAPVPSEPVRGPTAPSVTPPVVTSPVIENATAPVIVLTQPAPVSSEPLPWPTAPSVTPPVVTSPVIETATVPVIVLTQPAPLPVETVPVILPAPPQLPTAPVVTASATQQAGAEGTAVPEPQTVTLMLSGLFLMGAAFRNRR